MSDADDLIARQKEFVEAFFKRGAEFAEELLRENERLRFRVVQLEQQLSSDKDVPTPNTLKELVEKIHKLEQERAQLLARFATVEAENREYVSRFREIERENNNLASLYVAAHQLHSTLDAREVLQIVLEIVLNFVGAKTFALYLVDEDEKLLRAVAAEGVSKDALPTRPLAGGLIATAVTSGQPYYGKLGARDPRKDDPAVVVPLRMQDRPIGAIAIWELLQQKPELLEIDYEIFQLLGAHAASALEAAYLAAVAGDGGGHFRLARLEGIV